MKVIQETCVCAELDIYVFTTVLQLDVNTFQKDVRENRRGNQDNPEILVKPKGQLGQSRDSGNIGHTRHRTKTSKSQKHNITHTTKKMNSTEWIFRVIFALLIVFGNEDFIVETRENFV